MLRFFLLAAASITLFSIWFWAFSWMSLSDTFDPTSAHILGLWKIGSLDIGIAMKDFWGLIVVAFLLHAAIFYLAIRKNFLKAREDPSPQ